MIRSRFEFKIGELQTKIVKRLQSIDPDLNLLEDQWDRPGGGGGITNVLTKGKYIEKGGVNISMVHGELPKEMQDRLNAMSATFYASGISLVIHPANPFAPTVHFNIRYFELFKEDQLVDSWFGGGMDMTPYYIFPEDAIYFHNTIKGTCDTFDENYYPEYKKNCDEYFYNSHRSEHRGIGGIFFDYLKPSGQVGIEHLYEFTTAIGETFIPAYLPILEKRMDISYNETHKEWQEIRRGRYVEFNLIHDRGTLFGLRTNGRTESILMSLPPTVRWDYNHLPDPGSPEEALLKALQPKDWINYPLGQRS